MGHLHKIGGIYIVMLGAGQIDAKLARERPLDGAEIDYATQATGGQLQIRAPKIKGVAPTDAASLVARGNAESVLTSRRSFAPRRATSHAPSAMPPMNIASTRVCAYAAWPSIRPR